MSDPLPDQGTAADYLPRPGEPQPGLVRRTLRWARAHKTLAAAVAAVLGTGKVLRWAILGLFEISRPLPGNTVGHWLWHHPWVGVAVAGAVFAAIFLIIRVGLDWYERWETRQEEKEVERLRDDGEQEGVLDSRWLPNPFDQAHGPQPNAPRHGDSGSIGGWRRTM